MYLEILDSDDKEPVESVREALGRFSFGELRLHLISPQKLCRKSRATSTKQSVIYFSMVPLMTSSAESLITPFRYQITARHSKVAVSPRPMDESQYCS